MYHIMKNSKPGTRKDALCISQNSFICRTSRTGRRVPITTGGMKNVTESCIRIERKLASAASRPTGALGAAHGFPCNVRGHARRACHASEVRGAQIEGHCARGGATTGARNRCRCRAADVGDDRSALFRQQGIERKTSAQCGDPAAHQFSERPVRPDATSISASRVGAHLRRPQLEANR